MIVRRCQIWAVRSMRKNRPSRFCDCLTGVQGGVRPGIVMKEKDVFCVLVRTDYVDASSQFV